jgi:leader peptidase (prepilin peptidase)/N-methyltransferase
MPLLITAVGLLGLAIGSFLNVVIYRLPRAESLSHPSSHCPSCKQPIRTRHNLPVFGWLLLRGRCADCQGRISVRYPVVELATGLLFVGLTVRLAGLQLLPALPAYLYFGAVGIALSLIDLDCQRLPNSLVLPSYPVVALLLAVGALASRQPQLLLRAAIGCAALFALYFAMAFAYPTGMGFGDVKLAGLLGMLLGFLSWQALIVGAFAAFLIGGLVGIAVLIARRGTRKTAIPFGPFMITAALLAVFFASPLADLYTRLVLTT